MLEGEVHPEVVLHVDKALILFVEVDHLDDMFLSPYLMQFQQLIIVLMPKLVDLDTIVELGAQFLGVGFDGQAGNQHL